MKRKGSNRRHLSPKAHWAVARPSRRRLSPRAHQLNCILESAAECFGVWSVSSGQLLLSDPLLVALGYPPTNSRKAHGSVTSVIHPEDQAAFESALVAHLIGKAPTLDCEVRLRSKCNGYRWFQIRGKVVRQDKSGAPVRLAGMVLDVDGRKQKEEELAESHEYLQAIVQAAQDCIWVVDPVRFGLTAFNQAFENLIFSTAGIHICRDMRPQDINPAQATAWNDFYRKVRDEGTFARDWQLHPSGVTHHLCAQCLVRGGQVRGICVFGHDVTTHRRTEAALRQSEEKFEKVFRESPLALSLTSARDNRHIEVNDAYLETTGYTREELIGKTPSEAGLQVMPEQRVAEAIQQVALTGEVRNVEVMIRTKSGEVRHAIGSGALMDIEGQPCILGVVLDITDRKRAAEAVRESEERLRIAIEAGHMYAFEWDASTDVIHLSKQSIRMLDLPNAGTRHTRQELIDNIHSEDRSRYLAVAKSLTVERPEYSVVFRMRRQNGQTIWLEESGRGLFGQDGTLHKIIGIVSDETDVRQSERVLRRLSGRLITSQEEERRRIARELHDNIGQEAALLCVLAQRIDSGEANAHDTTHADVHELYRRIKVLAGDVSKLSHRLHCSELTYLGLKIAAERLCRDFEENWRIEVDCKLNYIAPSLDNRKSLCLYRVLQEALANVAKHSHASRVSVETKIVKNELVLEVRDDGKGFDVEKAELESGLGLLSMRERLNVVEGHLSIISGPGLGTMLRASVIV